MSIRYSIWAVLTLIADASAAGAQSRRVEADDRAPRGSFSGAYAGPEIGAHEHHFYLNITDVRTGVTEGRYYRAWGVGGGAFIGYELPLSRRVRVGAEAGISIGGENPRARFSDGTDHELHPRYGYRLTGKAGYLLSNRLMAYGTFGYGGHRYRAEGTATVSNVHQWGDSFTVGGGLEYRANRQVGIRLDFRHLDNQMSHILLGLPVRF